MEFHMDESKYPPQPDEREWPYVWTGIALAILGWVVAGCLWFGLVSL